MLSICIPVYNCHVTKLVSNLLSQLEKNTIPAEIILIDDASEPEIRKLNKELSNLDRIAYIQLEKNIGRSRIRNLFLKHSSFENLLFLDCDVIVDKANFLEKYISEINKNQEVICGGISYDEKMPEKQYQLRWKYGHLRESLSAEIRNKNSYKSFMTGNFVVSKKMLQEILFDERISGYGHEDTVFGFCLKQNKTPIKHINNPVKHNISETNNDFLKKTEQSLKNLVEIRKFIDDKEFDNELKILHTINIIRRYRLHKVLSIIYIIFKPIIQWFIIKNIGAIKLFDFYKLLFLSRLIA